MMIFFKRPEKVLYGHNARDHEGNGLEIIH